MKFLSGLVVVFILALSMANIFFYYQDLEPEVDPKSLEISYWENFLRKYPNYKDGKKRLSELKKATNY